MKETSLPEQLFVSAFVGGTFMRFLWDGVDYYQLGVLTGSTLIYVFTKYIARNSNG